jgi:hypothetical protein
METERLERRFDGVDERLDRLETILESIRESR